MTYLIHKQMQPLGPFRLARETPRMYYTGVHDNPFSYNLDINNAHFTICCDFLINDIPLKYTTEPTQKAV